MSSIDFNPQRALGFAATPDTSRLRGDRASRRSIRDERSWQDPAISDKGGWLRTSVRWRFLALCLLLGLAIGCNVLLTSAVPPSVISPYGPFASLWLLSFLPYLIACILILVTRKPTGRAQGRELAIILGGALILRVMLLYIPPALSHDSWRYLWDARVTLQGYSPYVYVPDNPIFMHLRDFLYNNTGYRTVPTIYPPGAQAFYLFSYLLAPSNLFVFKALLTGCELGTIVLVAFLLKKRGADPAWCILYAWCPLPIVEFAIQGHIDALTITLMLLTIVCAQSNRRGARILTGFFLALATLTKFYPILMLAVVLRRRDWALLATCGLTIVLAYVPYLILGHGQVLGFFQTYTDQLYATNAGPLTLVLDWVSAHIGLNKNVFYLIDLIVVGSATLFVWYWRQKERISMEAAILIVIGSIFLVSSRIFPWYTTALLPWVALLVGSSWTGQNRWRVQRLAPVIIWYFSCISILLYLVTRDWSWYYLLAYDITLLGLSLIIVVEITHRRRDKKANIQD